MKHLLPLKSALVLLPLGLTSVRGRAQSTIDSTGSSYAYGANTGWINFLPGPDNGARVTESWLSGYVHAANIGWINLGNGTPANGFSYSNSSTTDFGVNHDGIGNLAGFAWSANAGWINFGWMSDNNDANRPRIDLLTGNFSGYAWSPNTGWINLGTGLLRTATLACPDSDGDGIGDAWEMQWFGNLTTATASSDNDHDGATDREEYLAQTNPLDGSSFPTIVSNTILSTSPRATIVFTSHQARLYHLQTSTDFTVWQESDLGLFSPDAGFTTTRTFRIPAGDRCFIRVVPVKPLQP